MVETRIGVHRSAKAGGASTKRKLMNVGRGAASAFVLALAMGCGGSDAQLPDQAAGGGGNPNDNVTIDLPDGGKAEVPPAPPSPGVGGEAQAGIFVSSSKGLPGADGTKTRPVKTIAEGIELAVKQHLPVNVCAETYAEAVTLVDGITIFGFFDCSNPEKWVQGVSKAKIVSPTSPAVVGENLLLPAKFAGFEVEAPDVGGPAATDVAASSYGMVLRSSKNLALSELVIRAGKGQDGRDGVEPAEGNAETSNRPRGTSSAGPLKQVCTGGDLGFCNFSSLVTSVPGESGGTSVCKVGPNGGPGGRGGGGCVSVNGTFKACTANDPKGLSLTATAQTAVGGVPSGTTIGVNAGGDGEPGGVGALGTNGVWSFSTDGGFVPGDGTAGANGGPGQGGGGGAGANGYGALVGLPGQNPSPIPPPSDGLWRAATGAGGGAGGCGGIAGTAGNGGGASVGLLVVDSKDITITSTRIEGKRGGRAGKGAIGTAGTAGNAGGGRGANTQGVANGASGSAGGKGGDGGRAGLSGHGAPGPSIALVFKGDRPKTTEVTLVAGAGGDGYPAHVEGTQTRPAVAGEAKQEQSL